MMKILTAKQQEKAILHLSQLIDALMSENELKRLDAIGHTAELAYIIGGLKLMNMIKIEFFGV